MPRGLPLSYIRKWGISKLAWRKFRAGALTRGVPTRTAAIKRRLKGEKMSNPRRRRRWFGRLRRRRSGFTIPLALTAGTLATVISQCPSGRTLIDDLTRGDFAGLGYDLREKFALIDANGKFRLDWFIPSYGPLIVGALVSKLIGGRPVNINAMLARRRVPIIRI